MLARLYTALIALFGFALSPAAAGIFDAAPDVILCKLSAIPGRPAVLVAFYADSRKDDGAVSYKPLGTTALRITVRADSVIEAKNLAGCGGKTVQELRDAGRAFDLR